MSYFFGTTGTSSSIKARRNKHNRHQSLFNDKEIVTARVMKHHKKASPMKKCFLKPKSNLKESTVASDKSNLSEKNRNKQCLHKEIARLVEENRLLRFKLEATDMDIDTTSVPEKKDESSLKSRKNYQKLKQDYHKIQTECNKVNILLAQREKEFMQLRVHHEESKRIINNYEQEKNNFIATIHKFRNDNTQLNVDINLLKCLVYSLNVEIEKYQDKLRIFNHTEHQTVKNIVYELDVSLENENIAKSWGRVNFHALGPLLDAYQENLKEKDELIRKYRTELDDFTGRLKEIVAENDELHSEVESLKIRGDKLINEMSCLENDAIIVKEQNDLLTKQLTLQKQKLQEIHAVYGKKIELMSHECNKLHSECLNYKTELSNVKGRYTVLEESHEKLRKNYEKTVPVSVHNAAIDEYKKSLEELKLQYESGKKKSENLLKHLEGIQPESDEHAMKLTVERNQLQIQVRNSKKDLRRTKCRLEYLQKLIKDVEMSRDSFKQQLKKTTSFCEELVKEQEILRSENDRLTRVLEEKDKECEMIQFLGSNITHRMGSLKNQLKIVEEGTKKQLASVEKNFKNREQDLDQMKTEYQREVQRLKQVLQQKENVIQTLRREKCTTQDNFEIVWKAVNGAKKFDNEI